MRCRDELITTGEVCEAPMNWYECRAGEPRGWWSCPDCGGFFYVPPSQQRLEEWIVVEMTQVDRRLLRLLLELDFSEQVINEFGFERVV